MRKGIYSGNKAKTFFLKFHNKADGIWPDYGRFAAAVSYFDDLVTSYDQPIKRSEGCTTMG